MRPILALVAFALLRAASAGAAEDRWVLGLGVFDGNEFSDASGEARVEYRSGFGFGEGLGGKGFGGLAPLAGILVNGDGGVFGYGGLYADLRLGRRVVFTPMGGIGGYASGDGKDLGGVFQFVVGSELSYRFDNGARVGLYVTHLSNAGIHDANPGTESVLLTVSLPLDRLF
ncbi:MAG: acyloxyacyl hydrolase [Pseudomonadota bacterium]